MIKILEPAIYELLKSLAGGKVYHLRAKQGDTGPFIVYQRTDSTRWVSLAGPSTGVAQALIQIDCYSAKPFEAQQLGGQVETILDGYRGTVTYTDPAPGDSIKITGATLQNELNMTDQTDEPFMFRNSATYLITYDYKGV